MGTSRAQHASREPQHTANNLATTSRTPIALRVPSRAPTALWATASADPANRVARVRALQRAAGNRAVSGLLESADSRIAHALWQTPPEVDAVPDARRGRPLERTVRGELEPLVGGDLSGVRVHDDASAAASAEAVGARAYSVGEDIVFGPGRYAPDTAEGRVLLAHELGHVLASRRSGSGPAPILRTPKDGMGERPSLLSGVSAPRVSTIGASTVATIYFARDMSLMEPDSFAAVQKLAEQLSYMTKPFVSVDGHTSGEGSEKRNDELARLRREIVIAVLSSKVRDTTFAGSGHGASEPAVPETATDPGELEAERAKNRRVTIVITDLTSAAPPAPKPGPDIIKPIPPRPEPTPEEEFNRKLQEILKHPPDQPVKRSFSEQFWRVVDDKLDSAISKLGVPQRFRGLIKDGAHKAIEKGVETAFDSALDALHLSSDQKNAIKSAVSAGAQMKL
jgi:outer membrane protein OmpA-like peptidoglycan-associated protein